MDTKNRHLGGSTSPLIVRCSHCQQPIAHGPEYAYEYRARSHRSCLRRDVHETLIASQAHELWLKGFLALYCDLSDQEGVISLFKKCQASQPTARDYLVCLVQGKTLIDQSKLSSESKQKLADEVETWCGRIRSLLANKSAN